MDDETPPLQDFKVSDDDREIRFRGRFLGFSSTEDQGRDRWTEYALYRTEGGRYILSRAGKSLRFHLPECRTAGRLRPVPLAAVDGRGVPCPGCLPDGESRLADNDRVCPEQDRVSAGVYDAPEDLIESLMLVNARGVKYLTHVAREVIEAGARHDPDLNRSYYHVFVS